MKRAAQVLLFASLGAIVAHAQTNHYPQGLIKHVIVVIQENRTPDNLFGSNHAFENGVNLVTSGKKGSSSVTLAAAPLYTCYDIGHLHQDFVSMYDSGAMDGAYNETVYYSPPCSVTSNPMYAYAANDSTTNPVNEVQPYIDIAKAYGFANYMFQTNQGPSFPAHQFLFSGTSAPVYDLGAGTHYWEWFAADNPSNGGSTVSSTGCEAPSGQIEDEIDPSNAIHTADAWQPSDPTIAGPGYPCYLHYSIAQVLNAASVRWKYYTNSSSSIWSAPVAIEDVCEPPSGGGSCAGTYWGNVIQEVSPHAAQIMEDIQNCNLADVSFVTPDGAWSDHAGKDAGTLALGPSWVADIINLIGNDQSCEAPGHYWKDTVVLVTWDDWGGWYDHVMPPAGYSGATGNAQAKEYVYGFRVPLLVVSAYMATANSTGYVSGYGSGAPTSCPLATTPQYCHDFGSILNFIEYVFGSGGTPLGQIYSIYPYADHYAMDGPNVCTTCTYSLADFFSFNNTASGFTSISVPTGYGPSYFINYSGSPQDPDEDAGEN